MEGVSPREFFRQYGNKRILNGLSVAFIAWFQLDDLSHKSSGSSLNANQPAVSPVVGSLENLAGGEFLRRTSTLQSPYSSVGSTQDRPSDEWEKKLYGKQGKGKPVLKICGSVKLVRITGSI
jgi:hypothetical protein